MGWRIGQGIGPRLTYAQRKVQDSGFMDYSREADGNEADEEAKKHTYPRRDTPVIVSQRKDNFHGIGYVPGMSLQESLGSRHGESTRKGPNISGMLLKSIEYRQQLKPLNLFLAGFGLGALNDADEDDLDVYDSGTSKQTRTKMAYDADEAENDNLLSIGSSRARSSGRTHDAVGSNCDICQVIANESFSQEEAARWYTNIQRWSPCVVQFCLVGQASG